MVWLNGDLEQRYMPTFTTQDIIQYGYLVKEHLERLIKRNVELRLEQATCYYDCFYKCKYLFEMVDMGGNHGALRDFFNNWLSRDGEILAWVTYEEFEARKKRDLEGLPF